MFVFCVLVSRGSRDPQSVCHVAFNTDGSRGQSDRQLDGGGAAVRHGIYAGRGVRGAHVQGIISTRQEHSISCKIYPNIF